MANTVTPKNQVNPVVDERKGERAADPRVSIGEERKGELAADPHVSIGEERKGELAADPHVGPPDARKGERAADPHGNIAPAGADKPVVRDHLEPGEVVQAKGDYLCNIGGVVHHHVRDTSDGRWVYAPLRPRD